MGIIDLPINYEYEKLLDKSIFYTTDEVRELTSMKVPHQIYVKDKATWDKYSNVAFDRITIRSLTDPKKLISCSKTLLKDILQDNALIFYTTTISMNDVFQFMNESHDSGLAFSMVYVGEDGRVSQPISFKRTELVRLLDELIAKYPEEFSEDDLYRLNVLKMNVNYKLCDLNYKDDLDLYIDGKRYIIALPKLLGLLDNIEFFNQFINGELTISYKVIDESGEREESDTSVVAFMLKSFIEQDRIFDRFLFSKDVMDKYQEMIEKQSVNFQTLDKYNRTLDEDLSDKYEINKELIDEVNKYMEPTYSPLEKAVHIYIRLCQILTLDDEISNYEKDSNYKINQIKEKNNTNNKITRYQFMLIYSKFLKSLGIKYSNYSVGNPDDIRLGFKYGEYDVEINKFGYLTSDISNIKIDEKINCINSINKNKTTKFKFRELRDKVKNNIVINNKKEFEFKKCLEDYRKNYFTRTNFSDGDLFKFFFMSINRGDLVGLDSYAYLRQLFDNTLGSIDGVSLKFLSKRKADGYSFAPVALLTRFDGENYNYAIIDYNQDKIVKIVSQDQLKKLLDLKEYIFINSEDNDLYELGLKGGVPQNVRKVKSNM